MRVSKVYGGKGFADVWLRDHFAWEYKGDHKDLKRAYKQVNDYREELGNPPLLVVSDFVHFEVHTNFTATMSERDYLGKRISGERKVSGALRTVNADLSEIDELDGLRLAIEIKPVNLAVGRAIRKRFGDIGTFAVNLHLKFPFCVVGGVLAIPSYEASGSAQELAAELSEDTVDPLEEGNGHLAAGLPLTSSGGAAGRRSTTHLIDRAIARLVRSGGRKTEGDAAICSKA